MRGSRKWAVIDLSLTEVSPRSTLIVLEVLKVGGGGEAKGLVTSSFMKQGEAGWGGQLKSDASEQRGEGM